MGGIFNPDSPLMKTLGRVADLLILNILVVICCLPVITAGAAFSAMHYVLLKMVRGEEGYVVKSFFRSFKENFKQATVLWLIVLLFIVIFILDFFILRYSGISFPRVLVYSLICLIFVGMTLVIYIFALQSHFVNTVRGTLRNAVFIMIAHLPRSVCMLCLTLMPVLLVYLVEQIMPLVLMLGVTMPAYGCAFIYDPVFRKYEELAKAEEPEEEPEADGGDDERIFSDELIIKDDE